jgi:hypothetical protein
MADEFGIPSAQETLRRLASDYEQLADDAEAKLAGRSRGPSQEAC